MMASHRCFSAGWQATVIVPMVLAALLLAGCASVPPEGQSPSATVNPRDPWESYNRSMTKFNDSVDKAVLKPVATAYTAVLPSFVRTGVSNFFGNLGDAWSFVNNLLEADAEGALYSFWRVAVNTTFGLGGLLDPATQMRLDRHRKDFGLTLGRWGMPPGPYLVLPIVGPSTLRDTVALPVDMWGNLANHFPNIPVRDSLFVLRYVDIRAQLVGTTDLLNQAALDPYSFTRDVWLQKRRNDVYNGNPPPDDQEKSDADAARYDQPEASAPESGTSKASVPEAPASPASPAEPTASTPSATEPAASAASAAEPDASAAY